MKVDQKLSIWGTYEVPEEVEREVLSRLKEGEAIEDLADEYNLPFEYIVGSEESMDPEENDGAPTVEALNDKFETVYSNADYNDL